MKVFTITAFALGALFISSDASFAKGMNPQFTGSRAFGEATSEAVLPDRTAGQFLEHKKMKPLHPTKDYGQSYHYHKYHMEN